MNVQNLDQELSRMNISQVIEDGQGFPIPVTSLNNVSTVNKSASVKNGTISQNRKCRYKSRSRRTRDLLGLRGAYSSTLRRKIMQRHQKIREQRESNLMGEYDDE